MKNKDQILLENAYINIYKESSEKNKEYYFNEWFKRFENFNVEDWATHFLGSGKYKFDELKNEILKFLNNPDEYNITSEPEVVKAGLYGSDFKGFPLTKEKRKIRQQFDRTGYPDPTPSVIAGWLNVLGLIENIFEEIPFFDPNNKYDNGWHQTYGKTYGGKLVIPSEEYKNKVIDFLNKVDQEIDIQTDKEKKKREDADKKWKEEDDYISKTNPFIGGKYGSDRGWSTD
jgi:hypothetical protein